MLVINPKRINESVEIKPYWYNYYAGYSHTFTKNIIESETLPKNATVVDPWNGAGTTTLMASVCGYRSIGIDLNPVMSVIARAKQATVDDARNLKAIRMKKKADPREDDLLGLWFDADGVAAIRGVEKYIAEGVVFESTNEKVKSLSALQCVMYTALFNCLREPLKRFIPSNPTWVKRPGKDSEKVSISAGWLIDKFLEIVEDMVRGIGIANHSWTPGISDIRVGSSMNLPIRDDCADLIVTSPPYCTRIDYGVATLPELSVLCLGGSEEIKSIRRALMGTTTVPKSVEKIKVEFGEKCNDFLGAVKNHQSKASGTYYYKNLVQYFYSLNKSLDEIRRIMKFNSKMVSVVQDSFYKDLHCDLPAIFTEMAQKKGLKLVDDVQFESKANMANLNRKVSVYRDKITATESVLIFQRVEL